MVAAVEAGPGGEEKRSADGPPGDVPAPLDSPAERFEAFCNENPAACL
jgi:hypothetical protein